MKSQRTKQNKNDNFQVLETTYAISIIANPFILNVTQFTSENRSMLMFVQMIFLLSILINSLFVSVRRVLVKRMNLLQKFS